MSKDTGSICTAGWSSEPQSILVQATPAGQTADIRPYWRNPFGNAVSGGLRRARSTTCCATRHSSTPDSRSRIAHHPLQHLRVPLDSQDDRPLLDAVRRAGDHGNHLPPIGQRHPHREAAVRPQRHRLALQRDMGMRMADAEYQAVRHRRQTAAPAYPPAPGRRRRRSEFASACPSAAAAALPAVPAVRGSCPAASSRRSWRRCGRRSRRYRPSFRRPSRSCRPAASSPCCFAPGSRTGRPRSR